MTMSTSPSRVRGDSAPDDLLVLQEQTSLTSSTDHTSRGQYETIDRKRATQQNCLQYRDGAYYESRPIYSNFAEDRSFIPGFSNSSIIPITVSELHATDSSDSKMSAAILDNGANLNTHRSELCHEAMKGNSVKSHDAVDTKHSPLSLYRASRFDHGIIETTTEMLHSGFRPDQHRWESNYDEMNQYNENNILICCSDRIHRLDRYAAAIGSSNVDSLSEYEMQIKKKCDMETAIGPSAGETITITIGQDIRFRGAVETWKAIQDDFYIPCSCIFCNLMLFCIQDASYVLCPECYDVSPVEDLGVFDGGIGLGFTVEELCDWQKEIITNNSTSKCTSSIETHVTRH